MQTDGSSCGLFALSFAHTLCEAKDPSRVAYFVGTPSVLIVSLVFKTRHVHVLRVIEMSDYMQFSATIYTDRDNNPGVHSLLTRVHKSEVHIV